MDFEHLTLGTSNGNKTRSDSLSGTQTSRSSSSLFDLSRASQEMQGQSPGRATPPTRRELRERLRSGPGLKEAVKYKEPIVVETSSADEDEDELFLKSLPRPGREVKSKAALSALAHSPTRAWPPPPKEEYRIISGVASPPGHSSRRQDTTSNGVKDVEMNGMEEMNGNTFMLQNESRAGSTGIPGADSSAYACEWSGWGCKFFGSFDEVVRHEVTCKQMLKLKFAGSASIPGRANSSTHACEWGCKFFGSFDEVVSHEATCKLKDADDGENIQNTSSRVRAASPGQVLKASRSKLQESRYFKERQEKEERRKMEEQAVREREQAEMERMAREEEDRQKAKLAEEQAERERIAREEEENEYHFHRHFRSRDGTRSPPEKKTAGTSNSRTTTPCPLSPRVGIGKSSAASASLASSNDSFPGAELIEMVRSDKGTVGLSVFRNAGLTCGPCHILDVATDSPADISGRFRVGDAILAVDGKSVLDLDMQETARLFAGAPISTVTVLMQTDADMQARVKEFNRKKHTTPRSRSLVAGAPATPATDSSSVSPKLADKAKLVPVSSPVSASKLLPVPLARQGLQLFSCDFNCGFYGGFEDVSAHERSCELNPCITLGEVWA